MSARIGAVVVHWRGMDDTRECLASLAAADGALDVVVVVNGLGDFDDGRARAALPAVEIIVSATNRGYAGGCNLGAAALLARGAEILVFLNNDVVVEPQFFSEIARLFEREPDAGVAGSVVAYHDEPERIWSAGGKLLAVVGFTRHIGFRSLAMPDEVRAVDFVSGSAFAARREAWERTGGLDERYFHYFEDADLCERARALGYRSYVLPAPLVRHKVSASAGQRGSNRLNRRQAYYFARNRVRFIRKNFRAPQKYVPLASQILLLLPYEMLRALFSLNFAAMWGRLGGVIDGLRGVSGPLRECGRTAVPAPAGRDAGDEQRTSA